MSSVSNAVYWAQSVTNQEKFGFLAETPRAWYLESTQPSTRDTSHLSVQGWGNLSALANFLGGQ